MKLQSEKRRIAEQPILGLWNETLNLKLMTDKISSLSHFQTFLSMVGFQ